MSIVLIGFLASLGAGLLTGVGALPVLFGRTISRKASDMLLGFAAGVKTMLRSAEEIRRKQEASSSKGAPSKHENPTP